MKYQVLCGRCRESIPQHPNPDDAFKVILSGGYGMAEDGEVEGYLCDSCIKSFKVWLGTEKFQLRQFGEKATSPWPKVKN